MHQSEKELAKKMKTRLANERDRQRRWRSRQKTKGMKSITGMISTKAFDILQKERERTGERISDILEKAIWKSFHAEKQNNNVTNNETRNITGDSSPPSVTQTDKKKEATLFIEEMRNNQRLPFNEIARRLTDAGYPSPNGHACWEGRQVYDLFKVMNLSGKSSEEAG